MDDIDGPLCILEDNNGYSLPELVFRYCPNRTFIAQFQNQEHLETFLRDNNDCFEVEKNRVATYDDLETFREEAVNYFRDVLDSYTERRPFMKIIGHVGQADENVQYLINNFYSGREFKNFLLQHPDVFTVFDDDTVILTEKECVNFFSNYVDKAEGICWKSLQGHVGQAPSHIINYINKCYPGEDFIHFLQNNSHVFIMYKNYVFLKDDGSKDD